MDEEWNIVTDADSVDTKNGSDTLDLVVQISGIEVGKGFDRNPLDILRDATMFKAVEEMVVDVMPRSVRLTSSSMGERRYVIPLGTSAADRDAGNLALRPLFNVKVSAPPELVNLWFIVLWKAAQQKSWYAKYQTFLDNHLRSRLRQPVVDSLVQSFGLFKIPLATTFWLVLTSGDKDDNKQLMSHIERIPIMMEMVGLQSSTLPPDHVRNLERLMTFAKIHRMVKDGQHRLVYALLQNAYINKDYVALLDGPASASQFDLVTKMLRAKLGSSTWTPEQLLTYVDQCIDGARGQSVIRKVDGMWPLSSFEVPFHAPVKWLESTASYTVKHFWSYPIVSDKDPEWPPIHPATLRPTFDPKWKEHVTQRIGTNFFPIYRRYADFVGQHSRYPTTDEYITFCYDQLPAGVNTLPAPIVRLSIDVVRMYNDLLKKQPMGPSHFNRIIRQGNDVGRRVAMESGKLSVEEVDNKRENVFPKLTPQQRQTIANNVKRNQTKLAALVGPGWDLIQPTLLELLLFKPQKPER